MAGYALSWGDGRSYEMFGATFTFKTGSYETGNGLSVIEFVTRHGEEPGPHTHDGEDEMFFVVKGELEFVCGGETFRVGERGFVFLPRNIEHDYRILSDGDVELLIITAPPSWAEDLERDATPVSATAVAERARRTALMATGGAATPRR